MRGFGPRVTRVFAVVTILLGACAQQAPVMRPPPPALITKIQLPEPSPEREPEWIDLMADVEGDRMLPVLSGEPVSVDEGHSGTTDAAVTLRLSFPPEEPVSVVVDAGRLSAPRGASPTDIAASAARTASASGPVG